MIWATRYVEKTNYPTFLSSVCSCVFYTKWEKELSFFYMTNLVQFRPRFLHSSLRSGGLGPTSGLVPWSAAKREEKTAMVNCTSKWIVAAWVTDYHPSIANIFMWNLEEDVFISASSPPPPPLPIPSTITIWTIVAQRYVSLSQTYYWGIWTHITRTWCLPLKKILMWWGV